MTALISVSPTAAQGLRAVDVLNVDGTSTIDATATNPQGSTQPMRTSPANSIGSPVSVLNMALMHPRDGTVVTQGEELNASGCAGGNGNGHRDRGSGYGMGAWWSSLRRPLWAAEA